ncbi:hypothetical protein ACMFMG_003017 [Clarireedia jacksonii]
MIDYSSCQSSRVCQQSGLGWTGLCGAVRCGAVSIPSAFIQITFALSSCTAPVPVPIPAPVPTTTVPVPVPVCTLYPFSPPSIQPAFHPAHPPYHPSIPSRQPYHPSIENPIPDTSTQHCPPTKRVGCSLPYRKTGVNVCPYEVVTIIVSSRTGSLSKSFRNSMLTSRQRARGKDKGEYA